MRAAGARRLASLTTRGRCLFAGGAATAACAVVLDERDLLRIGAFVAVLPLLALLLAGPGRRGLRVARAVEPARLPVGADAVVTLDVRGSPLLGPLELTDVVPDAAGPRRAAPPRFAVARPTRSGAVLRYPLRPVLRGPHRLGPLVARVADPLGLAEAERELAGADPVLVLPRVVALHGLPPALGATEGTPGAAGAHQGQGRTDVLIRPYRQGDELRRVHWRSTARYGELMVRLEEQPWRSGTTILLDRRAGAHRGRGAGASMEWAVSFAASVCAHLHGSGEPVALVTEDGVDPVGTAGPGLDPLLDALARLRPSARTDLTGPPLPTGTDLLAVLGAVGPDELRGLLARRSAAGHAVLLDVAGFDAGPDVGDPDPTAAAAALRAAGWRVVVVPAGRSPEQVWDELAVASAPGAVRVGAP